MYTNEHTKSMKPHCILGSCSAQFLSIMGWERQEEEFSGERGSNSCSVMLKKKKNVNGQEESHRRGCGSYNWLLVQNTSLQIALFPELSSHHQSHLQTKQGDKQNKAWCREIKGTQWRKYSMSAIELFSVLFKLHMGFHRLRSGCLLAAINMELFYWYQTE